MTGGVRVWDVTAAAAAAAATTTTVTADGVRVWNVTCTTTTAVTAGGGKSGMSISVDAHLGHVP